MRETARTTSSDGGGGLHLTSYGAVPAFAAAPQESEPFLPPADDQFVDAPPSNVDLFGEGGPLGQGSFEVSFDLGYTAQDVDVSASSGNGDFDVSIFNGRIGAGYYLLDGLELGVDLQSMFMSFDGRGADADLFFLFVNAAPKYNFDVGSEWAVPYVGANLGLSVTSLELDTNNQAQDFDESETGFLVGGSLGMKIFPANSYNFFLQYDLNGIFFDDVDVLMNSLQLGISLYF